MKKLLFLAIGLVIFAACSGDKYDASLDDYEDAVITLQEAVQKNDQQTVDKSLMELRKLTPTLTEVTQQGSDDQKRRFANISKRLQDILQASINSVVDELDDSSPAETE